MRHSFTRHVLLFLLFSGISLAVLSGVIISQTVKMDRTGALVDHTHKIINESQNLSVHLKGMLAEQRGYLLTGDTDHLESYRQKKAQVIAHIAALKGLTTGHTAQTERLEQLQLYFFQFTSLLEETIGKFNPGLAAVAVNNIEEANRLKDLIIRLTSDILEEEYAILEGRIASLERQRNQYIVTFVIGGAIIVILLVVLNLFLLRVRLGKGRAERDLKEAEERLLLALEGTNDGIWDWNIKTGEVIYSQQFWNMLGYEPSEKPNHFKSLENLLHPDDVELVNDRIKDYLAGITPEYTAAFRMKHRSGKWSWFSSRGKAVYDKEGNPVRMVGAHTDITHIKAYEKSLQEAKENAESASRAKTEFLAHMSHEIRTPLTAISGIAEIFEKNIDGFEERHRKLIRTLGASTESLMDLINDILDFSRIESGEIELDKKDFALKPLFEQVISIAAVKANEKGLKFHFEFNEVKNLEIGGDKMRLRQILMNLIGNAIKFTEKGNVVVKAYHTEWQDAPALRIDVEDTGIGIAPENKELVFARFKQEDSSVSRRFGGSGLGLTISKSLARLMGGDILLESEPGKGSTFSLVLPLDEAAFRRKAGEGQEKQLASSQAGNDGEKILLVEDYEGNIVMLSYILESKGLVFDIAKTGREAVNLYRKTRYGLILMDIQMPEMDGFQATSEIRKIEKDKGSGHTPIIGMTAHALVGDKEKCLEAGMDAYLPKPIVEADLLEKIRGFLNADRKAA